jgi:hypothetical protein
MADISLSFSAEGGISLDDLVGIFTGTIDPSVTGEVAPIGSIFVRQNGQLFQKTGSLNTDWIRFSQGLGEAVKISATDTTSGYLNSKLTVSSSIAKTIGSPGGNETLNLDLADVGAVGTYTSVTTNAKGQIIAGTNPGFITANQNITISGDATGSGTNSIPITLVDTGVIAGSYSNSNISVDSKGRITSATDGMNGTDTAPFKSKTNAQSGAPSNGLIIWNNVVLDAATSINVSTSTANGVDISAYFALLKTNTTLYFQEKASGQNYQRWLITSITNNSTYYTFGVSLLDSSPFSIDNNKDMVIAIGTVGSSSFVSSISASAPAAGFTIGGSPITSTGTFTFTLADDLAAVEGISTTGIAVRTASNAWTTRTLAGTLGRTSITNADGVAGNPSIDIASNYVGQASITTLGTITTGLWQGTAIATANGGTGRTSIGTANQLLGVNTAGSALEYKTIAVGAGLTIALASNLITLTNSGVVTIAGTANQVIASAASGAITLSLPQSIGVASSPTFAQVTLTADPTLPLQVATKQYVDNAVQGFSPKQSVRAASTSQTTLSGLQTVDGVTLVAGNRVMIKNQTLSAENGIYLVSAGSWTRTTDMDSWTEVPGAFVFVEEGSTLADTAWVSTANQGGTLGTTAITWAQFNSAADITAGTGLTKVGNALSITNIGTAGSYNNVTTNAQGQIVSGSNVAYITGNQTIVLSGDITGSGTNAIATSLSATGVVAGTYKSVTVDLKGRITSATNPTTLTGFGITDAQPLNAFLTSLTDSLLSNGIIVKNGTSALARSIVVGSTKLSVTNANGTAGNPTLDVVESNIAINNLGGTLGTNKGGTGLAAIGTANQILGVNAGASGLEYKSIIAGAGITLAQAAGSLTISASTGSVTSVSATGSTGLVVGGSPITSSGTLTFTLSTELQALSGLAALGIVTRTAAGTYVARSITSGAGTITVTNPLGTAGNFGLDLTTVGTAGTYKSVTTDAFGRVTAGTNPTTLAGYGITDAVSTSQLGVANGVATLNASGVLNSSQIPASAITDTFVVASQAAQVALVAEVGDVAVRTDLNQSFILKTLPASTFANWQVLLTPTSAVLSVNGQTGIVDVGSVTSVGLIAPVAGITVAGSPITSSGNFTLALANDLASIENLSTFGIAVRTAADTWATRSLVAGAGISLTNADGVAGNITIASSGVTSVGLSLPNIFAVANSPVTSTGTLTASLNAQVINTVLAGPTFGPPTQPTFRTLGLATNDINDVTITSAVANQVLAYNGSRWVNTGAVGSNAAGLVGVGQSGSAAWTLSAGKYYADFPHALGTYNVVVTVFDTSTNSVVIPDSTVLTSTGNVRITVVGNTRTLRVVVVANGQSIVAGGSTPSSVVTAKDGVTISTAATKLNFTGQAVNVVDAGGGTTNITIGARYSYFANSLDTPNNADFAVNALAPVTTDPSFNSLNVRSFSNVVEQGVGFTCSIPAGATTATFKFRGRASTAPGASSVVQPRLYVRQLPNNAAVGAWSAANELANIAIPTNAFFQYATQTVLLSTLGITADRLYQFELTRRIAGVTGTNLPSAFLLAEVTVEFA